MSVAYIGDAFFGNTASGTNPSYTLTPGSANQLWLVFCQAVGNTNLTPTCSDTNTGGTYTLLFALPSASGANTLSCFVRNAVIPTTSTTVTVAIGAHTAVAVGIVSVSGALVGGAAAIRQLGTQSNQAAATIPAPVLAGAVVPGDVIFSAVGNATNPAGVSASANSGIFNWTSEINFGESGCGICLEMSVVNAPQSSATIPWGSTSATAFASCAVEVCSAPAHAGINVSKLNAYAVLAPIPGINVSKLNAYAVLAPKPGLNVSKLVAYAVLNAVNTNPPVWPAVSPPSAFVGNSFTLAWDLGTAASPTTYTLSSGSLPPGLALSNVAGGDGNQGKISGTPTIVGSSTFTVLATNAYGTASTTLTIMVYSPLGPPAPAGQNLGTGTVGVAYSATISATGGTRPYTFAVTSGALPGGLSLNGSTGVISGTPTTMGTFSFTITVTDANGLTGAQAFAIQVIALGGNYGFVG